MGVSFSCPLGGVSDDVENVLESVLVKSISFGDDARSKTPLRSVSFGRSDLEPLISSCSASGEMVVERSVSFKGVELEKMIRFDPIHENGDKDSSTLFANRQSTAAITDKPLTGFEEASPKHEAAVKLQKVYKSFRTRRKLADCAVLVEQSWWKLLDFAELKRSSISFFDIEKHETAISRWSRARTRAAKVGKGLLKNEKARKLALQHWLEAIDPRHRYGHNLHFYYDNWLHSKSRQPFFYWLDIGEGKEVNLYDQCPRSKLQQQCIKYLGPMERKAYEVVVEDGKLIYKETGELLNTAGDCKWIFVLSTSKSLYVGQKKKGTFQHSSFLAGGVTSAAGRLISDNGVLKAVWPHSGHYRPTEENFRDFLSFLTENNVDITDVKAAPDEEDGSLAKQKSIEHLRTSSEDDDLIETVDENLTSEASSNQLEEEKKPQGSCISSMKLTNLEIPKRVDFFDWNASTVEDGYESAEEMESVPQQAILERINSKKGIESSYQLGRQLSSKWTTGAGPRIGCVRDYPSELQLRALEQVNLSPRTSPSIKGLSSPLMGVGTTMELPSIPVRSHRSLTFYRTQSSSPLSISKNHLES
ncbi:IQ domain-containing protein IQM2 [Linum perenne]